MRDPLTWSVSLGRWLGVQLRVSIWFVLFGLVQVVQFMQAGQLGLGLSVLGLLWVSVLLHEFGHCFAARYVGGSADEILMWPLGGLAFVDVPNQPQPQAISVAGGPAVNALLCLAMVPALISTVGELPLNPLVRPDDLFMDSLPVGLVAYTFWLNWILLLINLLPGFPLDGARLLRCCLWPKYGFGRATLITVMVSKWVGIGLCVLGFIGITGINKEVAVWAVYLLALGFTVYMMSQHEQQMLDAGLLFDDSVFGYDFSQGYTSLEKGTVTRERRPSLWKRWLSRRAQLRRERDTARQREEERRVDEILARIAAEGMDAISQADRRFLHRASARYRSRRR